MKLMTENIGVQPEEIIEEQSKVGCLSKIKHHKFKILGAILGVLVFVGAVFGAYKFGQRQVQLTPRTPTPIAVATPTPDLTANWKTYTGTEDRYSIKYPPDWGVGIEIASFAKDGYSLTIYVNPKGKGLIPPGVIEKSKIRVGEEEYLKTTWRLADGRIDFERVDLKAGEDRFQIVLMYKDEIYDAEYENIFHLMLLTFRFLPLVTPTQISAEGKFCGGIAGNLPENKCPPGYSCQLKGKYPDASGVCVKELEKVFCQEPRPEICTMECIQNPPYLCGSDEKSYCSKCQACANRGVDWYIIQNAPCGR